MKFKIKPDQIGQRLDKFLCSALAEEKLSRSQIQKLIKTGQILVNASPTKAHYFLKADDQVALNKRVKTANKTKKHDHAPKPKISLTIIADQPDYLVINKPAGLIVHGAPGIKEKTLVDYLIKKYPEIKNVGDDPARPGIVQRLDKEVSGLLVIAKTPSFFKKLKKQFQERNIIKEYTALVHGQIQANSDQINFPMVRSSATGKMVALPFTKNGSYNLDGKTALTQFEVIKRYINFTLLKVIIKTGRMHQIRVHLAAYGHPVVGDKLYGTNKTKLLNKKLAASRIFLVADKLEFKDATGYEQTFNLNLPTDFKKLLIKIK